MSRKSQTQGTGRTSPYLDAVMANENGICNMQVVLVDIVAYSLRKPITQFKVIHKFMKSLRKALAESAEDHQEYLAKKNIEIDQDVVVVQSGDGAVVGFHFDGIHDMHLCFSRHLFRIVDQANRRSKCSSFNEQGWCNCHDSFSLRCGVSEGKMILYRDLNGNYNIAGDEVNLAARVMNLAGGRQIFLTEHGHTEFTRFDQEIEQEFKKYEHIEVKHGIRVNVYQYVDSSLSGLDCSIRRDLHSRTELPSNNDDQKSSESEIERLDTTSTIIVESNTLLEKLRNRMVSVPAGDFVMGNVQTRQVSMKISYSFLIDKFPVTQDIYEEVMKYNPSFFVGSHKPVESVSWHDAILFCNRLSEMSGLKPIYAESGKVIDLKHDGYRLPTEAEWEYACLGGGKQDSCGPVDKVAWYTKNSEGVTHNVGERDSNLIGLHDMLGNVWEWCNDWFQKTFPLDSQTDYIGPLFKHAQDDRVSRGGSWSDQRDNITCRSRARETPGFSKNTLGFRVVRRSGS